MGRARPPARRAVRSGDRMISARSAVDRSMPGMSRRPRNGRGVAGLSVVRPQSTIRHRGTSSICDQWSPSKSARSTWMKRCTSMPGTSTSHRRCSARRSGTTCCGRFLRPRPSDLVADLGCGSGRALVWNRDWKARAIGIDITPVFRRRVTPRRRPAARATCAGCRLPTALSPRPIRSTCSNTCRPRRCAAC